MIHFEVFDADGRLAVSNDWPDDQARQLGAYRMRWLRPTARSAGRWARTTDADGRVRTYGDVPAGSEAAPGRYGVFEWRADGRYEEAEPLKTSSAKGKAEDWRLDHRLGGGPELIVRWVEDEPAEPAQRAGTDMEAG